MGRPLTKREVRTIRAALRRGATRQEAACAAGVSVWRLYKARSQQLPDVPKGKPGPRPDREYPEPPEFIDISPEEIAIRAAEVRATWSEDEKASRWNAKYCPQDDA